MSRIRSWGGALRREFHLVRRIASDPRVPRRAKWFAAAAVAYAVSPIDLIPDFIPVIGQLDDLLVVPVLAWLAIRQVSPELLAEFRQQGEPDERS